MNRTNFPKGTSGYKKSSLSTALFATIFGVFFLEYIRRELAAKAQVLTTMIRTNFPITVMKAQGGNRPALR